MPYFALVKYLRRDRLYGIHPHAQGARPRRVRALDQHHRLAHKHTPHAACGRHLVRHLGFKNGNLTRMRPPVRLGNIAKS